MTAQELKDLIAYLKAQLAKITKVPKPKLPKRKPVVPLPPPFKPRFGLDYAWGNPSARQLRSAGVSFACRYLSSAGNSKNLRKLEARALRAAGLDVVTVFETTAARALEGYRAGRADAASANTQLQMLGAPATSPVYFAVDFDESAANEVAVAKYFEGVNSLLAKHRVGVYGGYWACKRLLDAGLVTYAWQTYAWSGGLWEPRANLRQFSNAHTVAGVSCDFDRAMHPYFGQWPK